MRKNSWYVMIFHLGGGEEEEEEEEEGEEEEFGEFF